MPNVRVRIAPSPTGALHIGTARTALFNYLFAKKHGGVFVLRIEDTDLERSDKKFEEDIFESLRWLGLLWDEGPDGKGQLGPYRQSERTESYTKRIRALLANGSAYHCFCSTQALEQKRVLQQGKGEALRYSGVCGKLSKNEAAICLANGESSIIRFRMPEKTISYTDLIRGKVSFDMRLVGDIAIAKDEKTPLYNFAAVVDDADMEISHVLRGEDHIANTPKQIALAEALGLSSPAFAHFPLVLGPDRSKLSKRHGATTVREFRDLGYYPAAMLNFLAFLGWNPGTTQELFSPEELVAVFDLSRIQKGGAIWNQEKLDWFNKSYAIQQRDNPPENAVSRITKMFDVKGLGTVFSSSGATASIFARISPKELESHIQDYSYYAEAPKNIPLELLRWKDMNDEDVKNALRYSFDILTGIEKKNWNLATIEKLLTKEAKQWAASTSVEASPAPQAGRGSGDKGKLLWPLRVALSGLTRSDSPFEIAVNIGKEETLHRLQSAIGYTL